LIWNFDETMLGWNEKTAKVVVHCSNKQAVATDTKIVREHITIGLCVSANGGHMTPVVILPLVNLPPLPFDYSDFYAFAGQESGWMTLGIFTNWVREIFIPELEVVRKNKKLTGKALLWVDGHSSRANAEAIRLLKDHNVELATFPSHTSHILQPLDNGVNRKFKLLLQKLYRNRTKPQTLNESRVLLLDIARNALYDSFNPDTVKLAFRVTGLYPWDPTIVTKNKAKVNDLAPPEPPKRQGININSSVLTKGNFEETIEAQAKVKAEKKAEKRKANEKLEKKTPPKQKRMSS
jgi:hypothetical protein